MKTTFIKAASARRCFALLALVCCLALNRVQAQYIPIDSGFAGILIGNGMGSCVNNFRLDTTCAKALTFTEFIVPQSSAAIQMQSLDGIQYIGKNQEGSYVLNRIFRIDSTHRLKYIPNLPSIYSRVFIFNADSLFTTPYPGDSATDVRFSGLGIHTIAPFPLVLTFLEIKQTNITQLPAIPNSLFGLQCPYNKLTSLPTLDNNYLSTIYINNNELTSLPDLPHTLDMFDCSNNHLTSISVLPMSLRAFGCMKNNLTSLPILPNSLEILGCSGNPLTALPTLPPNLRALLCSNNQLTSLPILPNSIESLDCSRNQLSQLPNLLNTVINNFNCSYNNFQTLPALPNIPFPNGNQNITVIANNNQIDSIAALPSLLTEIDLSSNDLSASPTLNDTLKIVRLRNNNISALPPLPRSLTTLEIDTNPISCLPPFFNKVERLTYNSTNISCIANQPNFYLSYFPLCTDDDACGYMRLKGRVYADRNSNCIYDSTDLPLKGYILSANNMGFAITDLSGQYNIAVSGGQYTIKILNVNAPFSLGCTNAEVTLSYGPGDSLNVVDFPLTAAFDCAVLSVDVNTFGIRLALPNTHNIAVRNRGCTNATNVKLSVKFEPELTPLSSEPAWDQLLPNNIVVFNIDTLRPMQELTFTILDSASINSLLGQTACMFAKVEADGICIVDSSIEWDGSRLEVRSEWQTGEDSVQFFLKNVGSTMAGPSEYRIYEEELLMFKDNVTMTMLDSFRIAVPANGKTHRAEVDQRPNFPGRSKPRSFVELAGSPPYSLYQIVPIPQDDDDDWIEIDCHEIVTAYDPNEKTVFPSGVSINHYITATDELEYILKFQNTGSDTAFNIKIVDTLAFQHLDLGTFESGVSSHPYTVSMQGNGTVTWRFANILLPDSHINEPLSHGFVKFKIKQKAGNQPGTIINNFVDIYFDYNAPVRTNTAFVTIEEKERIFSAIVEPRNIANGYSVSIMPNPFAEQATVTVASKYSGSNSYTFELFDITGRTVQSKQVEGTFNISRDGLVAGMYLFKITEKGRPVGNGKLIIK